MIYRFYFELLLEVILTLDANNNPNKPNALFWAEVLSAQKFDNCVRLLVECDGDVIRHFTFYPFSFKEQPNAYETLRNIKKGWRIKFQNAPTSNYPNWVLGYSED